MHKKKETEKENKKTKIFFCLMMERIKQKKSEQSSKIVRLMVVAPFDKKKQKSSV